MTYGFNTCEKIWRKRMKVYIAGPMRGLPGWNFEAFDRAERKWRSLGHHVFSPVSILRGMGYAWGDSAPVEPDGRDGQGTDHLKHVIQSDISCIFHSDAIALLPGWESSRGATVELALAQFLGLPVYAAETMSVIAPEAAPWRYTRESVSPALKDQEDWDECWKNLQRSK
jgi:hypothetical protein